MPVRFGPLQRQILGIIADRYQTDWPSIRNDLIEQVLEQEDLTPQADEIVGLNPTFERSAKRSLFNLVRRGLVIRNGTRRRFVYRNRFMFDEG